MTAKLQSLDDVTRMVGSVVRILGGNPGKFTLQGAYAGGIYADDLTTH